MITSNLRTLLQALARPLAILLLGSCLQIASADDAVKPGAGAPGETAPAAELGDTLSRINATGNFYVAVRESAVPFSYVLEDKVTPAGYSWELCQRVAKAIEAKLGKPVTTVPVIASASGRMMMVKVGMADIECGSTTNTIGRQRQVAFSNTFFVSEVRIMVRSDSSINSIDDLKGKRIVTTSGTNSERLIRLLALQRGISMSNTMGRTNAESIAMLARGEADAFMNDDAILLGARSDQPDPAAFRLIEERGITAMEPYGLVIRQNDPVFKQLVDETLVELFKSGEIEQIHEKWFNQPIPPKNKIIAFPLSDLNKAAYANPNDKAAN